MDFAVPLTRRDAITPLDVAGSMYANTLTAIAGMAGPRADWVPLPPETGYAYLRVSVHYFTGSSE